MGSGQWEPPLVLSFFFSFSFLDQDPMQYLGYCTGCNSPSPLSKFYITFYLLNFYFLLLLTFFLTFFNQWLRLKVAFCNYQSQPVIAIAPGGIPQVLHRIQIPVFLIYIYLFCKTKRKKKKKGKLQIAPLKFGVDWILHPKISNT